jgi:PhnB protein
MTEKSKDVRPIPEGYYTVTPWIIVRGAAEFIDFLKQAFGATEADNSRVYNEDGTIGHSEVRIGDSTVMIFDSKPTWPETPSFLRLYVEDANAVHQKALEAGASSVTEVTKLFFGDMVGRVRDAWGNVWWIQTHLEDVTPEEMGKRAQEQPYIEAMQQVQATLDRELSSRTRK